MSIEAELRALTDAVEALNYNLKVMLGGNYKVVSPAPSAPEEAGPSLDQAKPKTKGKPIEEAAESLVNPPTKDHVIAALKDLQQVGGPNSVKALLQEHGARNVGSLPEQDYLKLIQQAESLCQTLAKAA